MAPKPMPWCRWYSETPKDPKIKKAARMASISLMEAIGFWGFILAFANTSPTRGTLLIAKGQPYTIEDLAVEMEQPMELVQNLVEAFQKLGMLHQENDALVVTNFLKRNYESDSSTPRVKEFRQKSRCNNNETFQSGQCNVSETTTESDSESDTEEERGTPPPAFSDDPGLERVYQRVTSQITIPARYREDALSALRAICAAKPNENEAVVYLMEFYRAWRDRHYSLSNLSWLIDWAVAGQIPAAKSNGSAAPRKATEVWE